ncbi:MAG: hypothetical protein US25_C0022G0001 [Candidatus Moranbacteria bacterium GW2011_GWE1_36_7]|nr:MAG: hypothetical protein UR99_C0039G0001 [Candidatus Moranbacteria bacterium GW2011_GWD2_36_12]KKQ05141.1 MAG: hypothetical protein US16_C0038G0001 [Candidatus Moranbacteria bacterium GW2011_GWE2_36_40]KKQ14713.1 MAG: hypothetical protein US25_C0022G0001 [Candidatus Moranbacteria bacterium GW2011_GWE1_36_7]
MSLDDLNKELYNANSSEGFSKRHEQSTYDPMVSVNSNGSPFDQNQHWNAPQKGLSPSQKKKLWIFLSVFFLLLLIVGGIFFYQWWEKNAFHQDRVSISFEGPKETDSTQLTKYIVHYSNNNRVTLKNAEIRLSYSENFQPTDNLNLKYLSPSASKIFIGDIKSMSEGQVELKGIFYAPKDFPVYLRGEIVFVPSNGTNELSMENQIGVNITAAPVFFDISAPQEAVDGDSLDYVIDYKNLDIKSMANVQIRVDFPQGFQLGSAEPRPSEKDAYWYIGNLDPGQGGKIVVHGQIKGNSDEGKNIIASLGHTGNENNFVVYNKKELTTRIVSPILAVTQKLDDKSDNIVDAGEILKYSVIFQNTGTIGLRDAIVTAEIKGNILDFSKINIDKGSYSEKTNLITWKASDVPELANINPKASGMVHFSIPVKSIIPIENKLDKNFVISSVAKIDSPDIPASISSNKIIGSNRLDLRLASKVLFDTKGYYSDAKIKNSGPIPMETGKETTFTLHWSVINVSNDISEAVVTSALPTGIRWTGKIYPSNEKITYNERTNQLIWEIGDISAGAGITEPPRNVEFQVGATPQSNQIGEPVVLLNKSVFTAKDVFVEREIMLSGDPKNTQLYEDPSVGFANSKVAK